MGHAAPPRAPPPRTTRLTAPRTPPLTPSRSTTTPLDTVIVYRRAAHDHHRLRALFTWAFRTRRGGRGGGTRGRSPPPRARSSWASAGGARLPGFDGGNSPLEYLDRDLSARRAVLCTSNGSRGGSRGAQTRVTWLLGSVVNAAAVARKALSLAREEVRLVCAGTNGEVSLDDVLGAACIARELVRLEPTLIMSDSVKLALKVLSSTSNLEAGLREARHAALLASARLRRGCALCRPPQQLCYGAAARRAAPGAF